VAGDTGGSGHAGLLPQTSGQEQQEHYHQSGTKAFEQDAGRDKNGDTVYHRGSGIGQGQPEQEQ